ncbi:pilus assembly protein PilW, partial [Vibrio sp. 10N.286.49.E1]
FGSVERFRLQTEARFVLEKLSREVRHAVPNLFPASVSSGCVSFYPIVDSGFYAISGADINFLVSDTGATSSSLQTMSLVINPTRPHTDINNLNNIYPLDSVVPPSASAAYFSIPNG